MNKLSLRPRKTPATPAGDLVKSQNVIVTDSEDNDVKQNPGGAWTQVTERSAADLTYIYSETADDYLEFEFVGTALWLRYYGLPDGGEASISIDDEDAKTLNTYAAREQVRIAFVASNLKPGETHKVKIEVAGTNEVPSFGYKVAIDAFIVELSRGSQQIWSMVEESVVTSAFITPEPLQVRPLIGVAPLLPTGRVIFQDDFEAPTVKWTATGADPVRVTTHQRPYSGEACLRLSTPATAGTNNKCGKRFNLLPNKRIGFELWFLIAQFADVAHIEFDIEEYDGTNLRKFGVRYLPNAVTPRWQYIGSGGLTNITGGSMVNWHADAHQHLKLVVDITNELYVYFAIANQIFDLSSLAMQTVANTNDPNWFVAVQIGTDADAQKDVFIDDVIVTNYEP